LKTIHIDRLTQAEDIGKLEAQLFLTKYDSPEETYEELANYEGDFAEDHDWFPYDNAEHVVEQLEEAELHQRETREEPLDNLVELEEFHLLGEDQTGLLHFYRYTPTDLELVYGRKSSDGQLTEEGRERVEAFNPKARLQQYKANRQWNQTEKIQDHNFRDLPPPEFSPNPNQHFGGSLQLDGGEYVLPLRLGFNKVAELLENESGADDVFVDYRPQYLELAPVDSLEKYRLLPFTRGPSSTGTEIVDRVQVRDRGTEEKTGEWMVDELAQPHFIELLSGVDGVDSSLSELLIEEYRNIRTNYWATTSDIFYLQNTFGVRPADLREDMKAEGLDRNEHSPDAGRLHFPERRADDISERRQKKYFNEVLEPQEDEEEQPGEQSGFEEF